MVPILSGAKSAELDDGAADPMLGGDMLGVKGVVGGRSPEQEMWRQKRSFLCLCLNGTQKKEERNWKR
jgi:hypothetical protein